MTDPTDAELATSALNGAGFDTIEMLEYMIQRGHVEPAAIGSTLSSVQKVYESQTHLLDWLERNDGPELLATLRTTLSEFASTRGIPDETVAAVMANIDNAGGIGQFVARTRAALHALTSANAARIADPLSVGTEIRADSSWDASDIHKVQCGAALGIAGMSATVGFLPGVMLGAGGAVAYCIPALLE